MKPVTNCHTHVFTAKHVPNFLSRSMIPWPFCYFLPVRPVLALISWWYKNPARIPYTGWYKRMQMFFTSIHSFLGKFGPLRSIIGYYFSLQAVHFVFHWIMGKTPATGIGATINQVFDWLDKYHVLWHVPSVWLQVLIVLAVFLFIRSGRNLIIFIAKNFWGIMKKLPGKQTKETLRRYLYIGRYTFRISQGTNFSNLQAQHPEGSSFVLLPMDMEYMGAGNTGERYRDQLSGLDHIRVNHPGRGLPFIFADPRRIQEGMREKRIKPGEKIYFSYLASAGKVTLGDCVMKEYLEDKKFSGIKIYPALGYYPFDPYLLALWKYAADKGIPIMTHCVRGPMYYRGPKKNEWNQHPIFCESVGRKKETDENDDSDLSGSRMVQLQLPEAGNPEFTANFTHPMNFLCLLEEPLLRITVRQAIEKTGDQKLKEVFGFTDSNTPLLYTLSHLKICIGHYGGGDQWVEYFEKDRYPLSNQIIKKGTGIKFFDYKDGTPFSQGKVASLWRHTDWYSIISSMMMKYDHVYADISYILHNDAEILPLLKQTLADERLRKKVLYGTDFFVVRNHKSDKQMLADMTGGLSESDFEQIARVNPGIWLQRN